MTLDVHLQRQRALPASEPVYKPSTCALWSVPSTDMHTTACVNWIGIQCTLRAPEIQRAKDASMFSRHPMSSPEVHAMLRAFTTIKQLRNILPFGMRRSMKH